MENLAAFITLFLKLLPALIASAEEIYPLISRVYELWSTGGQPTDADWQTLRDLEARQTAVIQAPIPGDP